MIRGGWVFLVRKVLLYLRTPQPFTISQMQHWRRDIHTLTSPPAELLRNPKRVARRQISAPKNIHDQQPHGGLLHHQSRIYLPGGEGLQGSRFRVQGSGSRFQVAGVGLRVLECSGFKAWEFRVEGLAMRTSSRDISRSVVSRSVPLGSCVDSGFQHSKLGQICSRATHSPRTFGGLPPPISSLPQAQHQGLKQHKSIPTILCRLPGSNWGVLKPRRATSRGAWSRGASRRAAESRPPRRSPRPYSPRI